jgi:hypothetical protein
VRLRSEVEVEAGVVEKEEEEEFIQNRTRAGAQFLTRWDQRAVA